MKVLFYSLLAVFILVSCNNQSSVNKIDNYFPSDTVLVENDYPGIDNEVVLKAMQDLKICTLSDTSTTIALCDYTKFRIFPVGPNIDLAKSFILEMKEGVYDSPVKQVLVIEKSFNKYKIINRYLGFLMEYRTTESGYNDLLMGYKDPEMGLIGIKHAWDKEKYEPVDVEEINGYFIQEALKDSINQLFLPNFNAGY
ncbi:hypothetical protein [Putridiphycobacter roseus]|nr:hypothetical protein [Putridiphycobacter roseus]